jgi:hypothetical protein
MSRAPSVAGLAGALQICLFRLVHEPERLRVLRLRRCPDAAHSPSRFERRTNYTERGGGDKPSVFTGKTEIIYNPLALIQPYPAEA